MKACMWTLAALALIALFGCVSAPPREDLYSIETVYQAPDSSLRVEDEININLRFPNGPPDTGELYKYEEKYSTFTYSGLMKALQDAVEELFPNATVMVESDTSGDINVDFEWLQPQLRAIDEATMTVDMIWQGRIGTPAYTLAIQPSVMKTGAEVASYVTLFEVSAKNPEYPGMGEALGSAIARVAEEIAYTYTNGAPKELLVFENGSLRWLRSGGIDYEFTTADLTLPDTVKDSTHKTALIENVGLAQAIIADFDNDGTLDLVTLESTESGPATLFRAMKTGGARASALARPSAEGRMLVFDRDGDGQNELYYFDPQSGTLSRERYTARADGRYDLQASTLDFSAGSSSWGLGMEIKRLFSSNITGKGGDLLIHYVDAAGETSKGILFINSSAIQSLTLSSSSATVFADLNGDGLDDFADIYESTNSTWDANMSFALSNGRELVFGEQPNRFLSGGLTVVQQGADEQGDYTSLVGLLLKIPGIIGLDLNGDRSEELLVIDDLGKKLIVLSWQANEFLEVARYSLPFTPVSMSHLRSEQGHIIDVLGVMENDYYVLRIEGSHDRFVDRAQFSRIIVENAFSTVDDMTSTRKGVCFVAHKNKETGGADLLYVFP
jgi:hypothetical protein